MRYLLMHEDIPVCISSYNKEHDVLEVLSVYNLEHMPTSVIKHKETEDKEYNFSAALTKWAVHRTIPSSRPHFDTICSHYGFHSRLHMALKTGGRTLTDHYWFKKERDYVCWRDISFLEQSYKDTVFIRLLIGKPLPKRLSVSPGFMTNGIMPKLWLSASTGNIRKDYLLKSGTAPEFEEPLNEYLAYKLIKSACDIPIVKTSLCKVNKNILCSKTESFTGKDYEFIPACDVTGKEIKTEKALYDTLISFAKENGISNYEHFLQSMLTADFLISNRDRHLGNFGFLRDAVTLKIIGPAPLFDNGTSLLKPEQHDIKRTRLSFDSKPFSFTWDKQMRFIKEVCFDAKAFKDTLHLHLRENPKLLYDSGRKEQIEELVCNNIHHLDRYFEKIKENELER